MKCQKNKSSLSARLNDEIARDVQIKVTTSSRLGMSVGLTN